MRYIKWYLIINFTIFLLMGGGDLLWWYMQFISTQARALWVLAILVVTCRWVRSRRTTTTTTHT